MRFLNWLMALLCVMAVAACGGGGGSAGTNPFPVTGSSGSGGTTTTTGSLQVALSTTNVTPTTSSTITVTLKDASGAGLPGQVVSFSTPGGLGAFSVNTVLTSDNGVASVTLMPSSAGGNGADLVIASATVGGVAISGTVGFIVSNSNSSPNGVPSIALTLSSSSPTAAAPSTVTALVKDAAGAFAVAQVVKFSTVDGLGAFSVDSALTDANGRAVVSLAPATSASKGADLVVAQATVGGVLATGSAGFSVAATNASAGGTTSITLSLSNSTVTTSTPSTVVATLLDNVGAPYPGQLVKFASVGGLGTFDASSVLTDNAGKATVHLSPASSSANGADLVQATVTLAGSGATASTPPTSTIGFQVIGSTKSTVAAPSIAAALSTTTVSSLTPATLSAVITDAMGVGVAGQVVNFSSPGSLGTFTPNSALTDGTGRAVVTLSPAAATTNGADLAVAQASVNGTLVTASVGYAVVSSSVAPVGTPSIALALSTNVVTIGTPATATATVRDSTGVGIANQVVKFSSVDGLGSPSPSSALTSTSGVASVQLVPLNASTSGADQLLASTTVGSTALQASQGFQLTANNVAIASFTSDKATLNSYDQATLTVALSGTISGTPVNVAVSSACVAKAKASLTPATVTTTTGSATFTYRDLGCGATDTADSLQASLVGTSVTQSLVFGLTAPMASSITFATATPTTIFLKGSGLTETSTVIFKVVDTAGNGLPNQSVDLAPTTLAGGLTLDTGTTQVTKLSDSLGNVSVLINSGTVPTPVRVKATLSGTLISTVSSNLAVAVGLPSEINFSLSQQTINIEGYNIDGTPNIYSIVASDRLANPVPLNTAINFVAEGGQVEPIKFTTLASGLARAAANFISAEPRPTDGRLTIVAYAIGEESFIDLNGNNVWDAGEPFQDLGDIYIDRLFDGIYQPSQDQFIALSLPGATTAPCVVSTQFPTDPSIPSVGGSTCDGTWGKAYVRRKTETVLSTSVSRPLWYAPPSGLYAPTVESCDALKTVPLITGYQNGVEQTASFYQVGGNTTIYGLPTPGTLQFLVADNNPVRFNPVAAGSTITVTGTTGLTASIAGGSPVPSTALPNFAGLSYEFTAGTRGIITLSITSPSGLTTTVQQAISTDAAPGGAFNCQ